LIRGTTVLIRGIRRLARERSAVIRPGGSSSWRRTNTRNACTPASTYPRKCAASGFRPVSDACSIGRSFVCACNAAAPAIGHECRGESCLTSGSVPLRYGPAGDVTTIGEP